MKYESNCPKCDRFTTKPVIKEPERATYECRRCAQVWQVTDPQSTQAPAIVAAFEEAEKQPQPPTAAQIAWLLQQGKLKLKARRLHHAWEITLEDFYGKLDVVADELLEQAPSDLEQPEPYSGAKTKLLEIQHRKIAELEAERDDLKRQLAEARAVTVGDSWTPDNARFNELCDLANPELGPSIVADVPDYHPGAVVHCQCQYDPDE